MWGESENHDLLKLSREETVGKNIFENNRNKMFLTLSIIIKYRKPNTTVTGTKWKNELQWLTCFVKPFCLSMSKSLDVLPDHVWLDFWSDYKRTLLPRQEGKSEREMHFFLFYSVWEFSFSMSQVGPLNCSGWLLDSYQHS